jgi:hypothetical protein
MKSARKAFRITLLALLALGERINAAEWNSWAAAYIQSGFRQTVVAVFPLAAPRSTISLPESVRYSKVIDFGTDGRTLYVQTDRGILKILLGSLDQDLIPGTQDLASIWSLTVVRRDGRLFVSGIAGGRCGTFEIDGHSREPVPVLAGRYPQCGGGGGVVSPDAMQEVRKTQVGLRVTDLRTGASRVIRGFESGGKFDDFALWLHRLAWSPDGRWISVVDDNGRIILCDADSLTSKRYLGRSFGRAPVQWSPDSKYVLVEQARLRCTLDLYFTSLTAINIETGEKTAIKASQCAVGPGWLGWIDASVIR